MTAFNEQTCERCGICFEQCPFMQLPVETAKEEISKLIETRSLREVLKNCAGCSYCNIVCPTGSNPYELIREIRLRYTGERGVICTGLITEEIPHNLMAIGLEIDTEDKKRDLNRYDVLRGLRDSPFISGYCKDQIIRKFTHNRWNGILLWWIRALLFW